MSFGPNPWHQTNWDARAAGNFIGGGAGSGLIVATAYGGPTGMTLTVMLIAALALVGFGLFCVWLEIGRPLRAVNVFINPRTSWMSREAFVGLFLFPVGAVTAFLSPGWLPATVGVSFFKVLYNAANDHRRISGFGITLDLIKDLPAINSRHHDVQRDGKRLELFYSFHSARWIG